MQLVGKNKTKINGLYGVPEDGGAKQRLVLDVLRVNCHFMVPENPELPQSGLFMHPEKAEE